MLKNWFKSQLCLSIVRSRLWAPESGVKESLCAGCRAALQKKMGNI
jgi:hypothetical protein